MTSQATAAGGSRSNGPELQPRGLFVGVCTVDLRYTVEEIPKVDEKITALSQDISAGGPATNAAVTFAALGGHATLVTALGRHPLAHIARMDLEKHGVRVIDCLAESEAAPAISTILVKRSTGERTVVSLSASHQTVSPPPELAALVAKAGVLLVDGHHPALALAAARAAQDRIPVVLDAGSWKPVFDELLPLVDHCVCSAVIRPPSRPSEDADLLPPQHHLSSVDLTLRLVQRRCTRSASVVAMTRGGESNLYIGHDQRITPIAVPLVDVKDTLGAGDAFHGAYAYLVARHTGLGASDLLRGAGHVASVRCTVAGPRAWLDTELFVRAKQYLNCAALREGSTKLDATLAPLLIHGEASQ